MHACLSVGGLHIYAHVCVWGVAGCLCWMYYFRACVMVDLAHVSPRLNLCGLRRYFICLSACSVSLLVRLCWWVFFCYFFPAIEIFQLYRGLVCNIWYFYSHTLCVKCLLRLKFIPYIQPILCVLQVFLCSVGHPNSSWSAQWIGPSPSITVILWALPRGKI